MHTFLRRLSVLLLVLASLSGALGPTTVRASAPPRLHPASLSWTRAYVERAVRQGAYHRLIVVEDFRTTATIDRAEVVARRVDGGIRVRILSAPHGVIYRGLPYAVEIEVVAPAATRVGLYVGVVRVVRREGVRDGDAVGAPFVVAVRITRRAPVRPGHQPAMIRWSPSNRLGVVTLTRG